MGLAVEIHDDEEMLSKYEDEVEEEIESRKEKKGWSGIKNILAVQKASKLFLNNKQNQIYHI